MCAASTGFRMARLAVSVRKAPRCAGNIESTNK
nr:MAG TPA: hypothetical protein [Caudoviricetes sp.]